MQHGSPGSFVNLSILALDADFNSGQFDNSLLNLAQQLFLYMNCTPPKDGLLKHYAYMQNLIFTIDPHR